jgi:NAD(P)-dependent dehydrogenase (short-subunit alcohol dehydrogenase family)
MPTGQLPDFSLVGKIALVTGATRGLGLEICHGFAAAGADLVVVSRHRDACETVAQELGETYGCTAIPAPCNVGNWSEIDALIESVYSQTGRIDVLVNNAGMSPLYDSVDSVSEALFDKVIAVNLKGPFRLCAAIGTRMAAGAGGSIINVSSAGAVHPRPHILPYAAAKSGLNTLTVGLAHTFGPSVRVNAIMPGTFMTDVSDSWDMEAFAARANTFALKRGADPSEIVGAALYLASNASSYTTGAVLSVDGGQP